VELFLPRGKFKDDPVYGWKEEKKQGDIVAIHFNSGVHIFFKTYSQNAEDLQSGTCDAIFCDEELPEELYELIARLNATDGYIHMVFTATLGQDFWRR
jgi:phage terminase large subunit-like protein